MAEKAAGTGPHDDPGRRTWCASSPAPRTRTIDTKWFHGAIFVYLSVSLFTQRAICEYQWILVHEWNHVKPIRSHKNTRAILLPPSSWKKDGWISIGLEPLLGVQVETYSWFLFVEPCQAVGLFMFKWVLNVFLCFSPALNLESWYMEHYPWCWKHTGYQVEVSILNTAVKESSKRLPETGSKE